MKKISILCFLFLFLASCNINSNISAPKINDELRDPYIISYGTFFEWEYVNYATEYEIYCDGVLICTQTENRFNLGEIKKDCVFFVIAKNNKSVSCKSNEINVSKNCNFSSEEVLDLSNYNKFTGYINSQIRKIIINKNHKESMELSSLLEKRSHSLFIEISNVDLFGRGVLGTYDSNYSKYEHNYDVFIDVSGNCSIKGMDGIKSNYLPEPDTEFDGIDGGHGHNALLLSSLTITGSGNLIIEGGCGGDGSSGSDSTTYSEKTIGKGSSGGNGGNALICSQLVVDLDEQNNTVTLKGGLGGKKGEPGKNGSIITGPLVSMMYDDIYDIGKNGLNGKSFIGVAIVNKGELKK